MGVWQENGGKDKAGWIQSDGVEHCWRRDEHRQTIVRVAALAANIKLYNVTFACNQREKDAFRLTLPVEREITETPLGGSP